MAWTRPWNLRWSFEMLEIFFLAVMGGGMATLAKKRGLQPWTWVGTMVAGYLFFGRGVTAMSSDSGAGMAAGVAWSFVVWGVLLWKGGGGKRTVETWLCPECGFFNDSDTIFCPCGYELPDSTQQGTSLGGGSE